NDPMVGHGTMGNGQNMDNPLGAILRIDPMGSNSGNGAYGIPASNPFVGEAGLDEIYAYGLRNPYRLSFDSMTGTLYAADVGQNDIEEVNVIISGGNYGWNMREGSFGFFPNGNNGGYVFEQADNMGTIDPMVEYDHDEGIAIIGGFVYRGSN
ncbi:PQQ-dependent sugar dehydrogenase, partial [Colwellia marinimaniae]|uniref:PQQ-dependent sugar dehydrogenase n=1 Tax=Colwellia marinimaniae TaxID=1513592 RepID=UPI00117D0520